MLFVVVLFSLVAIPQLLCALAVQMGPDYTPFAPLISRVINKYKIQHSEYDAMVCACIVVTFIMPYSS